MPELPIRSDIQVGMKVSVELKQDQGSGKITNGIVKDILTHSDHHPYGIMVELENNEIGRVKKLVDSKIQNTTEFEDLGKKIIPKTEDAFNEFKETFQFNVKASILRQNGKTQEADANEQQLNSKDTIRKSIARAICTFGNAKGGFLYIGINENGEIMGLNRDVQSFKIKDYNDDFARRISQTLENYINDKSFILTKLQMEFIKKGEKTICIIQILPSDKPLFLEKHNFYVRGITPTSVPMPYQELVAYCKIRFPSWIDNQ